MYKTLKTMTHMKGNTPIDHSGYAQLKKIQHLNSANNSVIFDLDDPDLALLVKFNSFHFSLSYNI